MRWLLILLLCLIPGIVLAGDLIWRWSGGVEPGGGEVNFVRLTVGEHHIDLWGWETDSSGLARVSIPFSLQQCSVFDYPPCGGSSGEGVIQCGLASP